MKIVIDIPEEDRKDIGNINFFREDLKFKIGKAIMNGTPLDSVKAEIEKKYREVEFMDEFSSGYNYAIGEALETLDNIGKAESEEEE